MRLGQLARKLALRPSELVDFLLIQKIKIDDGVNTRLDHGHVELILKKFAPFTPPELAKLEKDEDIPIQQKASPAIPEPDLTISKDEKKDGLIDLIVSTELEGKQEVIKPAKVELPGLRVVGRIELPEAKKKTPEPPAEPIQADADPVPESEKKPLKQNKKSSVYKRGIEQLPRKNPIELAREQEETETRKKRHAEAEYAKEQRTKNYYKRVRVSSPTKPARLIEEASVEMPIEEVAEAPKTLISKLIRWFKT
jgi:hypothetical protein